MYASMQQKLGIIISSFTSHLARGHWSRFSFPKLQLCIFVIFILSIWMATRPAEFLGKTEVMATLVSGRGYGHGGVTTSSGDRPRCCLQAGAEPSQDFRCHIFPGAKV